MKLSQKVFKVLLIFFVLWSLGGGVALAQGQDTGGATNFPIPNPLSCGSDPEHPGLEGCVRSVIRSLLILATPIVAVMVIIWGYQILTAGGDPEKFSKGKKTILYAAAGFAVILLANGVVLIIQDVLSGGACTGASCPPS